MKLQVIVIKLLCTNLVILETDIELIMTADDLGIILDNPYKYHKRVKDYLPQKGIDIN